MAKQFWDLGLNPIQMIKLNGGFLENVKITYISYDTYEQEGVDQRLYAHDRMRLNSNIFDYHIDSVSSGDVDEIFEVNLKEKRRYSNDYYHYKERVNKDKLIRLSESHKLVDFEK